MNKNDIIAKLNQVDDSSYYISVSENHPLDLYLGKNDNGEYTLRFNGNFTPVKIKSSETLKVKQLKMREYNSILFSYEKDEDPSFFYSFCEDVINNTFNSTQENGYAELVNRFNNWKKLFSTNHDLLSEKEIMGLIGELTHLKEMFEAYGQSKAIEGWTGSEPTKKDFSYDDTWHEVKTTKNSKNSVEISSLDQLDSDTEGKLVVYSLQKMSPSFNGINLNKLALGILDSLSIESDRDLFTLKLKQAGYFVDDSYNDYVYEITNKAVYTVKEGFPRIQKSMVPAGIGEIRYELYLNALEKFMEK